MVTRVQKWGNSLGVRLPRSAAQEARVSEGSAVDVRVRRGEIVVRPLRQSVYRLADLVAGVRTGNLHAAVETGRPVGRELL